MILKRQFVGKDETAGIDSQGFGPGPHMLLRRGVTPVEPQNSSGCMQQDSHPCVEQGTIDLIGRVKTAENEAGGRQPEILPPYAGVGVDQ